MEYRIVRVGKDNYPMFDDMLFWRKHGREKSKDEQAEQHNFSTVYSTLENENLHVFAAQLVDQLVGYISIVYIPKISRTNGDGHLFIDELWVNPAFRKQGIASTLLAKADILATERNPLGLRLYVNTTNDAGIALYRKFGYTDKYGTALFMEKELKQDSILKIERRK